MRVIAIRECFVENCLRAERDEFEYNGVKNDNLEPVDGEWPEGSTEKSDDEPADDHPKVEAKRKPGPKPKVTVAYSAT